jgi:hypothetical protein
VNNVEIFRPRSGYVLAGVVLVMGVALSASLWVSDGFKAAVSGTLWAAAAIIAGYLVFVHPKVTIFDEGVKVTNPFLTVTLGWNLVEEIEVRYALTFVTNSKKISAWAATAPGRYHGRTVHPSELKGYRLNDTTQIRPGESPRTSSGEAAQLCRIRLENFRIRNLHGAETAVKFNLVGAITLPACIVAALVLQSIH